MFNEIKFKNNGGSWLTYFSWTSIKGNLTQQHVLFIKIFTVTHANSSLFSSLNKSSETKHTRHWASRLFKQGKASANQGDSLPFSFLSRCLRQRATCRELLKFLLIHTDFYVSVLRNTRTVQKWWSSLCHPCNSPHFQPMNHHFPKEVFSKVWLETPIRRVSHHTLSGNLHTTLTQTTVFMEHSVSKA